jgi:5-methylcytosine-specific restriction endonuclease McrA
VLEKRDEQREAAQLKRAVYAEVDRRDRYSCRCCGHPADTRALDMVKRGHRHHLRFRSRGGQDTTSNVLLLCAFCHGEIHAHRLFAIGTDCNKRVRFERLK